MTCPSAKTASRPRTESLIIPYLITIFPPAFVEIFPPIVHEPLAPKSTGSIKLYFSASSCTFSRGTPDCTVMVLPISSTSSIDVILSEEIAICPFWVMAPSARPVSPP